MIEGMSCDIIIKNDPIVNYDYDVPFRFLQNNCHLFFPMAQTVNVEVKCIQDLHNDISRAKELYEKHSLPNKISDDGTEVIIHTLVIQRRSGTEYGTSKEDFENTVMNSVRHCAIDYYAKFGKAYHVKCGDNPRNLPNPIMLVIHGLFGIEPYIGKVIQIDTDVRRGGKIITDNSPRDFLFHQIRGAYAIEQKELNQDNHEND